MDYWKDGTEDGNLDSLLGMLKWFIWFLYLCRIKYLEITKLMVYFVEPRKHKTAYGKLDGSLYWISLRQENGTELGYSVRFVCGEVDISKAELVI